MSEDTPTRRTKPQRSNSVKVAALTLMKSGTPTEVSRQLKIPVSTLGRWKRDSIASGNWDIAGAAGDNNNVARPAPRKKDPGSGGHNRLIDDGLKRRIRHHLHKNPFLTPRGIQDKIPELKEVSKETIRRCIAKDLGLPSRLAAAKPHLTEAQKERRLDWARKKQRWSQRRWRKVLWSDETHIELWRGFRHGLRVRRSSSISRYDPRFIRRTVKFPPKLMIWAAIGNGRVGRLHFVPKNQKVNSEMYREILRKHLRASMRMTGCSIFMQDGAPCHTSVSSMEWLEENDVHVLDWVGQSCDMNPIENCWHELNRIILDMPSCSNLDQLAKTISKAWKKLSKDRAYLTKLTDSMPRRIAAVLESGGEVTKY